MSSTTHKVYIYTMVFIAFAVTVYLSITGFQYYNLPLEERFYHARYDWFKPAGIMGHGLGILGTLMILFGVLIYIFRKRYNFLSRQIRLKYLLEFHIFLCTLGSILILFHTSFKFGGIVSIAFWSMVAVVISGVIGRYIYIQIPRNIEGKELNLQEVHKVHHQVQEELMQKVKIQENVAQLIEEAGELNSSSLKDFFKTQSLIRNIKSGLKRQKLPKKKRLEMMQIIRKEIHISQRIGRLQSMQKLFKHWHVAHLPFALIMLIIVLIHVGVTLALGYNWIL